jgi:5-methylcytosine-specific restriction endonuclease McrA
MGHGEQSPQQASIDHVWAKSRGGTNREGNTVISHRRCNNEKSDRRPTPCEQLYADVVGEILRAGYTRKDWMGTRT